MPINIITNDYGSEINKWLREKGVRDPGDLKSDDFVTFCRMCTKYRKEEKEKEERELEDFITDIKENRPYTKENLEKIGYYTDCSNTQLQEVTSLREQIKSGKIERKHDPKGILNDYFYEYYLRYTEKYDYYKKWYWIGVILWMTSVFWVPFLFGTARGDIGDGFLHLIMFSFTTPVTLPLSFFIGLVIHPAVLKRIMFNERYPYSDYWNAGFGTGSNQERNNKAAVFTGTLLGSLTDKK